MDVSEFHQVYKNIWKRMALAYLSLKSMLFLCSLLHFQVTLWISQRITKSQSQNNLMISVYNIIELHAYYHLDSQSHHKSWNKWMWNLGFFLEFIKPLILKALSGSIVSQYQSCLKDKSIFIAEVTHPALHFKNKWFRSWNLCFLSQCFLQYYSGICTHIELLFPYIRGGSVLFKESNIKPNALKNTIRVIKHTTLLKMKLNIEKRRDDSSKASKILFNFALTQKRALLHFGW